MILLRAHTHTHTFTQAYRFTFKLYAATHSLSHTYTNTYAGARARTHAHKHTGHTSSHRGRRLANATFRAKFSPLSGRAVAGNGRFGEKGITFHRFGHQREGRMWHRNYQHQRITVFPISTQAESGVSAPHSSSKPHTPGARPTLFRSLFTAPTAALPRGKHALADAFTLHCTLSMFSDRFRSVFGVKTCTKNAHHQPEAIILAHARAHTNTHARGHTLTQRTKRGYFCFHHAAV